MKKNEADQDYEFSYTDKDLFESGLGKEWCPLFGELPTIFVNRRKHQVADRCVDIIIAARNLWEIPYPYLSGGTILTQEHLALSNPNWPDPDEIPGYQAAILAARSIVWWNHFHIVTNARDYCKSVQVPYPYHWHENDAGILHYARSSMSHFAQPGGVEKEICPLLMYPPGSPEDVALKKYERNISIQEEARKVPDYLVFAALAIAEAWEILADVLYHGARARSVDVQSDLRIAEKFLEKAHRLRIGEAKKDIEEADNDISALAKYADALEKDKIQRQEKEKERKKNIRQTFADRIDPIKNAYIEEAQYFKNKRPDMGPYTVIAKIKDKITVGKVKKALIGRKDGDRKIRRYIESLYPKAPIKKHRQT